MTGTAIGAGIDAKWGVSVFQNWEQNCVFHSSSPGIIIKEDDRNNIGGKYFLGGEGRTDFAGSYFPSLTGVVRICILEPSEVSVLRLSIQYWSW